MKEVIVGLIILGVFIFPYCYIVMEANQKSKKD